MNNYQTTTRNDNRNNSMNAQERAQFYSKVDTKSYASIVRTSGVHYLGDVGKGSAKVEHTAKNKDVLEFLLYLTPYQLHGHTMCPNAETCKVCCLAKSGRNKFGEIESETAIDTARRIRTELWLYNRKAFMQMLCAEINRAKRKAERLGKRLIVRLNGTSDIPAQGFRVDGKCLPEIYPDVQFVEYTKVVRYIERNTYANLDYTLSFNGENAADCRKVLEMGVARVAVVFAGKELPKTFAGYEVVDGDLSDVRCDEPRGVIVGLRYKRTRADIKARRQYPDTPFVVKPNQVDFR